MLTYGNDCAIIQRVLRIMQIILKESGVNMMAMNFSNKLFESYNKGSVCADLASLRSGRADDTAENMVCRHVGFTLEPRVC